MSQEHWYRNSSWGPATERAFLAKLSRARSQRDQYLVIQCGHLSTASPADALKLVDFYFETRTNEFEDVRALLARADALWALGRAEGALAAYKDVLAQEQRCPSHLTDVATRLPLLIARNRLTKHYEFAVELAGRELPSFAFKVDVFRRAAARALIFDDLGASEEAAIDARMAVKAAGIRRSGFRYHQDLGLVGEEYKDVLKRLHNLAA